MRDEMQTVRFGCCLSLSLPVFREGRNEVPRVRPWRKPQPSPRTRSEPHPTSVRSVTLPEDRNGEEIHPCAAG